MVIRYMQNMVMSAAIRRPPVPAPSQVPAGEFLGTAVDKERRRGRGTLSNTSGRYEPTARIAFDDGWRSIEELPAFETTVTEEKARKIDRSINPFRGCEHGCVYCFARPTHANMGLSAGLDFESRLFVKPDAPELLERELSSPSYSPKVIAIGTNTDPYQPIERKYQVMRGILEVLERAGIPTSVMVAPVIPAINDAEIERILDAALAAGAKEAGYVLLRLPLEVRDLFREWLMANFPDRYRHVFKLIRDTRGGKDYDSKWGERMTGNGPIAWMIGRRFEAACERLGLNRRKLKLTTEHFAPTHKRPQQLALF
jgi:DNA repair photolyase